MIGMGALSVFADAGETAHQGVESDTAALQLLVHHDP